MPILRVVVVGLVMTNAVFLLANCDSCRRQTLTVEASQLSPLFALKASGQRAGTSRPHYILLRHIGMDPYRLIHVPEVTPPRDPTDPPKANTKLLKPSSPEPLNPEGLGFRGYRVLRV